ncbi:hypothetical protein [Kosakonia cowanii]|jgi:hypothetical protein|uniref:hypothetical protein n=1 Tax=Kosakonia cowanii TaxID=208223 RepID=UPI0027307100|nr:hypothetical protein [Kosakonia cowanii]WKW42618.1 hypothetical protein PZO50_01080 [Kosakonia cowanii]
MNDLLVSKVIAAVDSGKIRGFDEIKEVEGELYFYQYAMKKKEGKYVSYFFSVLEKKMEQIEDYGFEEIIEHDGIAEIMDYFKEKGVGLEKFSSFKGVAPF